MAPQPVIDVWMQHPTERFLASPFLESLRRWIPSIPSGGLAIETTLAAMDAAGVRQGILSAWHGPGGALISNEEVHGWVNQHPGRLFGLAAVDLAKPMEAIATLRRCVREQGFVGLRVVQWLWGLPCTHPLYYPLFATCVELDVPVCLQVGLTGPLATSETGRPLHIERVALDFPELKIVCGHIGYPWHEEMIAFATKFPNVYIDTSAYKAKRYPPALVAYLETNGRKKVLFGSNYPMISPADCLADLAAFGLSDEVREAFLHGNARSVFKL